MICDKSIVTYHKYRARFPYSVNNCDIDYNWCVLSLSLFESGAAWQLFVQPALGRSGEKLRELLLEHFPAIMARYDEFNRRKVHDLDWLWNRFQPESRPRTLPMGKNEVKKRIKKDCCNG